MSELAPLMFTDDVGHLKGARGLVLLALLLTRETGPHSVDWLMRKTNLSDKPVMQALKYLEEIQVVTRVSRYAWQLNHGCQQLPLMTPELDDGAAEDGQGDTEIFRVGNIPGPVSSSSGLTTILKPEENLPPTTSEPDPENLRVPAENSLSQTDPERFAELCDELRQHGIYEPKRSEIANRPGMNARTIRERCDGAPNTRLAIYRLLNWDVLPMVETVSAETVDQDEETDEEEAAPEVGDVYAGSIWKLVAIEISKHMSGAIFRTWFDPNAPARMVAGQLQVLACNSGPSDIVLRHIPREELREIVRIASMGGANELVFVTNWSKQ